MKEEFAARIAEAYGHHSQKYASILEPNLRPMADEIVSQGRLRGGELVLDLATGTGLIARTAARSRASVEVRRRFLEDRERTFEGTFNEEVWADAERGCETLRLAGFAEVHVATLLSSGRYGQASDAIEVALAWPLTRYRIARLDPEDQQRLRKETAAAILEVDDLSWKSEIHIY
jgi:hypothetical protein